jgi:hypothetical protein
VAKVGRLLTLASFLDSGEFSASMSTKAIVSFSEANLLNFGFIILQFPHHDAENWTTTLSFWDIKSPKVSSVKSINIAVILVAKVQRNKAAKVFKNFQRGKVAKAPMSQVYNPKLKL